MGRQLSAEAATIAAMIKIYCNAHHSLSGGKLCAECQDLLDYAEKRISLCPYGENKPTCAKCPIHCFSEERREAVKKIMRYAGPRMLSRHPLMTLRHMWQGLRKPPKS